MTLAMTSVAVFLIGVLVGTGLTTHAQDARERRQAHIQRSLNEQWRALRQEPQAGLSHIDYATTNETPRRVGRRGSY